MRLRLGTRIGISSGIAIVSMLVILVILIFAFERTRYENVRVHEDTLPSIKASGDALLAIGHIDNDEFLFFEDGGHFAMWQRAFQRDRRTLEAALKTLDSLPVSKDERALLDRAWNAYQETLALDNAMLKLMREGRVAQARQINNGPSFHSSEALRQTLIHYQQINYARSADARHRQEQFIDWTMGLTIAVLIIGILLSSYQRWRATTDLVQPLRGLQRATEAIASGEFRTIASPEADKTIEVAALERDFNRMGAQLQEARQALLDLNASLETQVQERTADLGAANKRLGDLVRELETLDKLKSDFMAVMSHELLTPIALIGGFASGLEDDPLTETQQADLTGLQEGIARLTRMVRNVLDYTQLIANRLTLRIEVVDYEALIRDALEAMRPQAEAKQQQLVAEWPASLPLLCIDSDRTTQALWEVLDNAIKFTPEGRTIDISFAITPTTVVTAVHDPGIGIPEAALPTLFKPFQQVDFSATRHYGGMGLGLAIAHDVVNKMEGDLTIESHPGDGTTVRISLPRATATDAA